MNRKMNEPGRLALPRARWKRYLIYLLGPAMLLAGLLMGLLSDEEALLWVAFGLWMAGVVVAPLPLLISRPWDDWSGGSLEGGALEDDMLDIARPRWGWGPGEIYSEWESSDPEQFDPVTYSPDYVDVPGNLYT